MVPSKNYFEMFQYCAIVTQYIKRSQMRKLCSLQEGWPEGTAEIGDLVYSVHGQRTFNRDTVQIKLIY